MHTHLHQHVNVQTGCTSLFGTHDLYFLRCVPHTLYLFLIFYPKFGRRLLSISHKGYKNQQFIYFWAYVSGNRAYMLTLTTLCQFLIDMVKGN